STSAGPGVSRRRNCAPGPSYSSVFFVFFFFFNDTAPTEISPLPLPAPLPIFQRGGPPPFQLSQLRGKVIALAIINTTCSHCQELTVLLKAIQKDYAARNVQVVVCAIDET